MKIRSKEASIGFAGSRPLYADMQGKDPESDPVWFQTLLTQLIVSSDSDEKQATPLANYSNSAESSITRRYDHNELAIEFAIHSIEDRNSKI